MTRVPHGQEHPVTGVMILTVMDLVAVLLQAPHFPLLQHPMGHEQLQEAPVHIRHDTRPPRTALHGART